MSSHPPNPSPRWLSEILDGGRTPPRPASSRCPYSRHLHPAVRWPSAETRWHPGHSQLALTPAGRLGIGRPAWPPTLDPTAAARSATEAHLPRHAPDSDPPRPRPYLALPSAGQRTADGWRGLVRRAVCLLTLRPTRRLGLVQHPRLRLRANPRRMVGLPHSFPAARSATSVLFWRFYSLPRMPVSFPPLEPPLRGVKGGELSGAKFPGRAVRRESQMFFACSAHA